MRILAKRQQEALSRDVSWLDNLIREERLGTAGEGPVAPARHFGRGRDEGDAQLASGQARPSRQCLAVAVGSARTGGTGPRRKQ